MFGLFEFTFFLSFEARVQNSKTRTGHSHRDLVFKLSKFLDNVVNIKIIFYHL